MPSDKGDITLNKKLNQLDEDQFFVLRGPLDSHRQSPPSLGRALLLTVLLQGFPLIFAIFILLDGWINTFILTVIIIYFTITGTSMLLSVVYAIPGVFRWGQKMQYFLSIFVIQHLIFSFLLIAMYFLSEELLWYGSRRHDTTETEFLIFVGLAILIGGAVFVAAFIRFYHLLKKGKFRKRSKRDELRRKLEKSTPPMIPAIMAAGTGVSMGTVSLVKLFNLDDVMLAAMLVLVLLLFYTMMFILPEQLVILYCKRRFKSFNFNEEDKLYPDGDSEERA